MRDRVLSSALVGLEFHRWQSQILPGQLRDVWSVVQLSDVKYREQYVAGEQVSMVRIEQRPQSEPRWNYFEAGARCVPSGDVLRAATAQLRSFAKIFELRNINT